MPTAEKQDKIMVKIYKEMQLGNWTSTVQINKNR